MARLDSKKMLLAAANHCWETYKAAGGTQESFAASAGVGRSTVSQMLSGQKIGRLPAIEKVADAFGYDMAEFLALGKLLLEGSEDAQLELPEPKAPSNTFSISPPDFDPSPLKPGERNVLEKVLTIMRCPGVRGSPDQLLKQSLKAAWELVEDELPKLSEETVDPAPTSAAGGTSLI